MRAKVSTTKKAVSQPVSLFPAHLKFAKTRANAAGMGLSRYVQILIALDQERNLLGQHLEKEAKKFSPEQVGQTLKG